MTYNQKNSVSIHIENLNVTYQGGVHAVKNLSLEISSGEFFTILGPSGSGKSSVLFAIAGLLEPHQARMEGTIYFDTLDVSRLPANERNIPFVFQNYALFPHMTVFENIAFPLRIRRFDRKKIQGRVGEIIDLIKLQGYKDRFPSQLSGGQKQRVALGRALAIEHRALLLDEPLGALDRKLRDQMQVEIKALQEQLGITIIYVTHDQTEALALSDKIAILNDGELIQLDNPLEIYDNPSNTFVADFIGESNLFKGFVKNVNKKTVECETATGMKFKALNYSHISSNVSVGILVRPENINFVDHSDRAFDNMTKGLIKECFYLGDRIRYQIESESKEIINLVTSGKTNKSIRSKGDQVKIGWNVENTKLIKA